MLKRNVTVVKSNYIHLRRGRQGGSPYIATVHFLPWAFHILQVLTILCYYKLLRIDLTHPYTVNPCDLPLTFSITSFIRMHTLCYILEFGVKTAL